MSFMLLGILNSQAAGGGASDWEIIQGETITTARQSVTFNSIPSNFKHLQIWISCYGASNSGTIEMAFNGSTSGNTFRFQGAGSIANDRYDSGTMYVGQTSQNNNKNATSVVTIPNYTNTYVNKSFTSFFGQDSTTTGLWYGTQYSTSAIGSLTLTHDGSFGVGSTIQMIGMP
jgi:hypothetical protein